VLTTGLTAAILLAARLTHNWTIVPAVMFIGAMIGPLAFLVWLDDRTRIGRSVAPDVLFVTWLVGGGVAMVVVGIFEAQYLYNAGVFAFVWFSATEGTAKIVVPVTICSVVPKYRTLEHALALALVSAAGFAVLESLSYAIYAYDESVQAVRDSLIERSLITPFGHLPWTTMAVVVAVRARQKRGRITLSPKALWGFGRAITLHATWNAAVVQQGWWHVLVIPTAAITFGVMYHLGSGVYYDGPYAIPTERAHPHHHRPAP
jgi:RsiW-degrading membrane proteinase PrsW (M82 family)